MKKIFKIMFFVSVALIVLFALYITVSASMAFSENDSAVGIIGGADGPTAIFVTKTLLFDNPLFYVFCVLLAFAIATAVGWVVCRKKQ